MIENKNLRITFGIREEFKDVKDFIEQMREEKKNVSQIICIALRNYISKNNGEENIKLQLEKLNQKIDIINGKISNKFINNTVVENKKINDTSSNQKAAEKAASVFNFD
jgi:hypothetical protein